MPEIHLPKTYLEYSNTWCWGKPVFAFTSPSLLETIFFVLLAQSLQTFLLLGKTGFCFHLSLTARKTCFCITGSKLAKFFVNKLAFCQLSMLMQT
jgi:hypothetical protein